jgi:hypothetical protein
VLVGRTASRSRPSPSPQAIEHARRVGPHVDPAADFGELRRLLVDLDVEAGAAQRHRGGETAEAGADDRDPQRRNGHDDATVQQRGPDEQAIARTVR